MSFCLVSSFFRNCLFTSVMRSKSSLHESIAVLGAIIPLISILKSTSVAFIISVSVLCAVLLFELIFLAVRRFCLRSLRLSLAFVVLSTVISAIWIAGPHFGFQRATSYLPLSLLSAFFLVQATIREATTFSNRSKTWIGFFVLAIFTGYLSEQFIRNFFPGLLWLVGGVVIASNLMSRRIFSHGS